VFRAQRNLFVTLADTENFTCSDLLNGFGSAWVTETTAARTEFFRYHFIEAVAYSLLEARYIVSIHGACVELDGHGVLLAGDSGAGKSTLSYACARRGWIYCSDDAAAMIRRGEGRTVLGNPLSFRFRETAGSLFPEFSGLRETRRAKGKPTIEVPTGSLPSIRTTFEARVDYIVFLNRREEEDEIRLIPVSKEEVRGRLCSNPWPPELQIAQETNVALDRLLEAATYEMRYRGLDAAVDRLEQLVREEAQ
jgi:serine kinase of HPr protein (carbohydrate metabolism regulator)